MKTAMGPRVIRMVWLLLTIIAAAGASALAQTPPTRSLPTFEAASVKQNTSPESDFGVSGPRPGGFTTTNAPLDLIIVYAFGTRTDQVLNLPPWTHTERFDIVTKYPDGAVADPQQVMLMVQALLAERFHLKTHTETREVSAYSLVVARRDGRLGPKLTPNTTDCAAYLAERRAAGQIVRANGTGDPPLCSPMVSSNQFIKASAKPIDNLAAAIAQRVGRPVINKTGLTGNFDINLEWSPELSAALGSTNGRSAFPNDGVPLVTAVQEQLGLKLESTRAPSQFIVIDQVEHLIPD